MLHFLQIFWMALNSPKQPLKIWKSFRFPLDHFHKSFRFRLPATGQPMYHQPAGQPMYCQPPASLCTQIAPRSQASRARQPRRTDGQAGRKTSPCTTSRPVSLCTASLPDLSVSHLICLFLPQPVCFSPDLSVSSLTCLFLSQSACFPPNLPVSPHPIVYYTRSHHIILYRALH